MALIFICLLLSLSCFGLLFYLRGVLRRLLSISSEMDDLKKMTENFSEHIEAVYEMEMFYGDMTLQALLEHARSYKKQLDTFDYIYNLNEERDEKDIEEKQDDEDTETEE